MHTRLSPVRRAILASPPVTKSAGIAVVIVAAAVMAAWIARTFGWTALPVWIYRMNPMTAASLAFAGTALLLPRTTRFSVSGTLKLALGSSIVAIGALKLAQLVLGRPAGIDLLLFPRTVQSTEGPHLMAPNTAIALVCLGGALMLSTRGGRRAPLGAQLLACASLAVAMAGLIAYAYGAIGVIEFTSASAMAFQTALALTSASIGVLWTRPNRALAGIITNPTIGGATARGLLPAIVVATVSLGALRVRMAGQGIFDEVTGLAILVTVMLITLVAVVLIFAQNLRGMSLRLVQREQALGEALMKLEHANRVTTMGQLTASIAHEISQPVAATVANAQAALNWLAASPPHLGKVRQMLGYVITDGTRAGDVIDRIRALIKKTPPRRESLGINEVMLQVIALMRGEIAKNRVLVRTQLANGLPLIQADRIQLQQVILNLIVNAIEAMGDCQEKRRELLIATRSDASSNIIVSFRDSGAGLDPKSADRLFEAFYTTKPEGMGMGLAICRSIIEANGGRIWASANKTRGSVIQFTLPPAETAPVPQAGSVPAL
jgi:signal transduction histidine kinase